jgi:hypothetical protein
MADAKIPSAEEIFQEEANTLLKEGTYEYQVETTLEQIKKLSKDNTTVTVVFKAIPSEKLLNQLDEQGYRVKFDTCYDSSKTEKYVSKLRITNPKFPNPNNLFMDNIEEKLKGCVFSTDSNSVEDMKKIFQSFMSSFSQ